MRVPTAEVAVCWSQTVECVKECAWQTLYCGLSACEKLAVASHLLAQPYPPMDVVVAAPNFSRGC